ncbi:MAG: hypothetical protein KatS3mg077_1163 [Candidatus Binatia bacterium]|nr:MAG: hypothetical protein KatS3mg077_1163 [Candidatus Binatia bacterium]
MRPQTRSNPSTFLFTATLASVAMVLAAGIARAADPLPCQSAKLSAQVNHARCIVRCQQRTPERAQPCEARCNDRLTRRLAILQSSPVCTGVAVGPSANNSVCDLQLLNAAWKQAKCYLRCDRLDRRSDTFNVARCNDRCSSKFDRTRVRVLRQPICSQHSGAMPSIN